MLTNRSVPKSTVIPQIPYPDVSKAAAWLRDVFGFTVRLTIGDHRIQMNVGDGAIVVVEPRGDGISGPVIDRAFPLVRVEDVHRHCENARKHGARIIREPADYPYGERQYTVEDFARHVWTFSQSIADVPPEDWGGESGAL
jgi:uncharacterized glyoxalase superfamily protein PhnB